MLGTGHFHSNFQSALPRLAAFTLLFCLAACGPSTPGPAATPAPSPVVAAPESRNFTGVGTLSGTRQTLDMGPGRRIEGFRLGGTLMLTGEQRLGLAFRSDFIGLSDSQTGLQARSVWTDERGEQVFSTLSSASTGAGNLIQGRIVGGTGRFAGLDGEYRFTWQPLVIAEDGSVSGRVLDLKGAAHLASSPGLPGAAPGAGPTATEAKP